ncbi:MAG: hypothetical protein L3J47_12430, partial [Sulfurovum sp.]|nr:hypothetical protein [Sulfurovum sp.]
MSMEAMFSDMRSGEIGHKLANSRFGADVFAPMPASAVDALEEAYMRDVDNKPIIKHTRLQPDIDMSHIIYNGMYSGNVVERPIYVKKVGSRYYICNTNSSPMILNESMSQETTINVYGLGEYQISNISSIDANNEQDRVLLCSSSKVCEFSESGVFARNVIASTTDDDPASAKLNSPRFANYTSSGSIVVVSLYGGENGLGVIAKYDAGGAYVKHIDSYSSAGYRVSFMKIIEDTVYLIARDTITILDADLNIISTMTKPRGFEESDFGLSGICKDDTHIYVASTSAAKIYKIDIATQEVVSYVGNFMFINRVDITIPPNAMQGVYDIEMAPDGGIIAMDYGGNVISH